MAVSKSEKQTLSKMWNKASSSTSNVVAGKYIFKIESAKYNDGDKGPSIREILKVTGGNEEFIGETVSVFNNLSTEQNMSFFKQKLQRLGIDIPEDFTEIEDGTVCEEMEGITFEGELKIKNGFVNVYVNKLVDADDEDDDSDEDDEEEDSNEGKDAEEPEDSEDEEDEEESDEDANGTTPHSPFGATELLRAPRRNDVVQDRDNDHNDAPYKQELPTEVHAVGSLCDP